MHCFDYQNNKLFVEQVSVADIVSRYGSPCYIYSRATLEKNWQAFDMAFTKKPHLICYAVKANSNIAILNLLARLGSGFDIVSLGEMERVLAAGVAAEKIVFSGVGKREDEIIAALKKGIGCFNVEVSQELDRINQLAAKLDVVAPISFRVNPDVNARTHPYIATGLKENKFGITLQQAYLECLRAVKMKNIKLIGVGFHIGSQLTNILPFLESLNKILGLAGQLKHEGIELFNLNLGGGLGICYQAEKPPKPGDFVTTMLQNLKDYNYKIILEPGRAISGNSGILVTKVEYLKTTEDKNFAIVDAAMNDFIRPALYGAWQNIIPVNRACAARENTYDIVGPICETGDFLGKNRKLKLLTDDLLAVCAAGAYGFSMSSNYNSRPRIAEIMIDGSNMYLIRQRETIAKLWLDEKLLP